MAKFKIHISIPADTLGRLDAMTVEDAKPHNADRSRWLADLIEAEWKRRGAAAPSKPTKGKVTR